MRWSESASKTSCGLFDIWFLDFNFENDDVLLIVEELFTQLRSVYFFSHIKNGKYKLFKIESAIPKGEPPNVELITKIFD